MGTLWPISVDSVACRIFLNPAPAGSAPPFSTHVSMSKSEFNSQRHKTSPPAPSESPPDLHGNIFTGLYMYISHYPFYIYDIRITRQQTFRRLAFIKAGWNTEELTLDKFPVLYGRYKVHAGLFSEEMKFHSERTLHFPPHHVPHRGNTCSQSTASRLRMTRPIANSQPPRNERLAARGGRVPERLHVAGI